MGDEKEEGEAREYRAMEKQLEGTRDAIAKILRKPEIIRPFLQRGRLIDVRLQGGNGGRAEHGWGVTVAENVRAEPRRSVGKSLKEVLKRFPDGVPQLNPKKDMGIKGDDFDKLLARRKTLEDRLASHALTKVEEEERLRRIAAQEKKSTP